MAALPEHCGVVKGGNSELILKENGRSDQWAIGLITLLLLVFGYCDQ